MPHPSTNGFTLIEMIVVIAITSVVGIALALSIGDFYRRNSYVIESAGSLDSARRGVAYVTGNFREALYGDDGSYPIALAATSSMTFYADVDKDGGVERTRIYIQNNTLYRGVTNAAGSPASYTGQTETITTIANNVRNGTSTPLFRYYNSSGSELTGTIDVSDIASMKVELLVDLNPNRAPDIYTLTGAATLRNIIEQ